MQKMVKPIRLVVLAVVFVLLLGVYFVALYKLQIIGGREYYAVGETETKEDITIAAARGNILDRYGRLLVSNSLCNNLSINVTELFSQDDPNAVILELCSAVERFGDTYTDTLPITKAPPFEFTRDGHAAEEHARRLAQGERHAARLQRRGDPRGDAYALQRRQRV